MKQPYCGNHFVIYIYTHTYTHIHIHQIIMLYILNLHDAVCQLYGNRAGENIKKEEETNPADILSWTSDLQNRKKINSCYLSHPVHCAFLWQPKQTNTDPETATHSKGWSMSQNISVQNILLRGHHRGNPDKESHHVTFNNVSDLWNSFLWQQIR